MKSKGRVTYFKYISDHRPRALIPRALQVGEKIWASHGLADLVGGLVRQPPAGLGGQLGDHLLDALVYDGVNLRMLI